MTSGILLDIILRSCSNQKIKTRMITPVIVTPHTAVAKNVNILTPSQFNALHGRVCKTT